MSENKHQDIQQLQMIYPERMLNSPPTVEIPPGYCLRTYQSGDQTRFFEIMELAGWMGWNSEKLKPWLHRILPQGWFMAVENKTGQIAATCMATHDHTWQHPFCGELGWLGADPVHTGKSLGVVVASAVTKRFIEAEYRNIHLYTEHFRLAAIKIYFKLGYTPFIDYPNSLKTWKNVCKKISWPFTPNLWS